MMFVHEALIKLFYQSRTEIPFNSIDGPIAAYRWTQRWSIDRHRNFSRWASRDALWPLGCPLELQISNFNQLTFPFQPSKLSRA